LTNISNDLNSGKLVDRVIGQIERLPPIIKDKVESELDELLLLIKNHRVPNLMVIGQLGAGKSSLINALLSAPVKETNADTLEEKWKKYSRNGKSLAVLEAVPVFEEDPAIPCDLITELSKRCPDIIVYLFKATEVETSRERNNADLVVMGKIWEFIKKTYQREIPIIFVLNQCDSLEPTEFNVLPTENPLKTKNIEKALQIVEKQIRTKETVQKAGVELIPISAFLRFRQNGTQDSKRDLRWNIEYLADTLLDELPYETKLEFARALQIQKISGNLSRKIVDISSNSAGLMASSPIPLADTPLLTTIQLTMVVAVASLSGKNLSFRWAGEFFSGLSAQTGSVYFKMETQRALSKFLPGFGFIMAGEMSASFTRILGDAAIEYFIEEKPMDEIKKRVSEKMAKIPVKL
jgi:uncharacterized protein (DUF697 family)/GTPase Era involved in 16S rRNA processing